MRFEDKLLLAVKAIVGKRVKHARECIALLSDVVETYVDDPLVKDSAEKCIKWLSKQVDDIEKIIKEL